MSSIATRVGWTVDKEVRAVVAVVRAVVRLTTAVVTVKVNGALRLATKGKGVTKRGGARQGAARGGPNIASKT